MSLITLINIELKKKIPIPRHLCNDILTTQGFSSAILTCRILRSSTVSLSGHKRFVKRVRHETNVETRELKGTLEMEMHQFI